MHAHGLLEIAVVIVGALGAGLLLQRLKQPAIVGYILAGVLLGPSGFELIENRTAIELLAELGVLLLLFIIGLELSLRAFRRVARIAVLCALAQIVVSVGAVWLLGQIFGWSTGLVVTLGFVIALSSTAVAMKILEEIGELRSDVGRTAVGVLIAQDLAVVPMLLLIQSLGGSGGLNISTLVVLALAIVLLIAMIVFLTQRERVGLPFASQLEGNVELTALTALAYCFGAAMVSGLVGLSPAYGAFLAGLWIGNSHARKWIIDATLPIQSVLLMAFFLSIGLLLDLGYIWDNLGEVLVLLLLVTLAKSALNIAVLRLLGEPWQRAWLAGVSIGQIGEFSFVLVAAGFTVGFIEPEGQKLAVAIIALSLVTSPLWLLTARRLEKFNWHGFYSPRRLFLVLLGKESRTITTASGAVILASGRAMTEARRYSLNLGHRGLDLYNRMAQRETWDEQAAAEADRPVPGSGRDGGDLEIPGTPPPEEGPGSGERSGDAGMAAAVASGDETVGAGPEAATPEGTTTEGATPKGTTPEAAVPETPAPEPAETATTEPETAKADASGAPVPGADAADREDEPDKTRSDGPEPTGRA